MCPDGEVLFEDRGGVAVKGAAAPIRMFLASQGAGGGGRPGSSSREGDDAAAATAAAPSHVPEELAKEPTSFGSTLLPRLGLDSSSCNAAGDCTMPGLVIGRTSSESSSVVMGWD